MALFALTGRPPFQEKTVGQLLTTRRLVLLPSLAEFRPDVPEELALVIARCLGEGSS